MKEFLVSQHRVTENRTDWTLRAPSE